ncbi:MAG: hypothetical protein ACOC1K_05295 [Nanoarchaeota archaeon]
MTEYEKQAQDFLGKTGTTLTTKFLRTDHYFPDDEEQKAKRDVYQFTLQRGKRKYTAEFGQSIHHSRHPNRKPPTPYDILACLTKYDPGTFEDFCSEYGYEIGDEASERQAKRTYKEVKIEYIFCVQKLFTDEEIEELAEIN